MVEWSLCSRVAPVSKVFASFMSVREVVAL